MEDWSDPKYELMLNIESWYLAYCKEVLHRKLALSQMIVQLHYSYLELLQTPPAR